MQSLTINSALEIASIAQEAWDKEENQLNEVVRNPIPYPII